MKANKAYFVQHGLAELGLSGAVFDWDPEDLARICDRLDADLAELETRGARVSGWRYADTPGVDNASIEVNIPAGQMKLVIMSAAIAAAPSIGKNLSSVTVAQLKVSRDNLMYFKSEIPELRRNTNMPVGSGNQVWADGVQYYVNRPPRLDAGKDSHMSPDMELWNGDSNVNGF